MFGIITKFIKKKNSYKLIISNMLLNITLIQLLLYTYKGC